MQAKTKILTPLKLYSYNFAYPKFYTERIEVKGIMKISHSLALLGYVSIALGLKQFQYCKRFPQERINAKEQQGINLTVAQDSSLLIFNLKDLSSTNIPSDYDLKYDLKENRDEFVLCSEKGLVAGGECSSGAGFNVGVKDGAELHGEIFNRFGKKGDHFFYPVHEEGTYCLYGHHHSEEYGVTYLFFRPYGSLTPKDSRTLKVLLYLLFPLEGLLWLFLGVRAYISYRNAKPSSSSFEKICLVLSVLAFNYHSQCFVLLQNIDQEGYNPTITSFMGYGFGMQSIMAFSAGLVNLNFIIILFQMSKGASGIIRENDFKFSKLVKALAASILFAETWVKTGLYERYHAVDVLMNFIRTFGYYAIYILMLKCSAKTLKEIKSIETKRKFIAARRLTILAPLFLQLVSLSSIGMLGYANCESLKDSQEGFVNFESSGVPDSFAWAVVENLPSFSMFIIVLGYTVIWREDDNGDSAYEDSELSERGKENVSSSETRVDPDEKN